MVKENGYALVAPAPVSLAMSIKPTTFSAYTAQESTELKKIRAVYAYFDTADADDVENEKVRSLSMGNIDVVNDELWHTVDEMSNKRDIVSRIETDLLIQLKLVAVEAAWKYVLIMIKK